MVFSIGMKWVKIEYKGNVGNEKVFKIEWENKDIN